MKIVAFHCLVASSASVSMHLNSFNQISSVKSNRKYASKKQETAATVATRVLSSVRLVPKYKRNTKKHVQMEMIDRFLSTFFSPILSQDKVKFHGFLSLFLLNLNTTYSYSLFPTSNLQLH